MMPGMMSMMPGAAGSRPYAPQMVSMQPGMMMQSGMNMMMRPMQPQMMRPPGPMYGGGPPVKGLQPYVNSYAARLKDGASTLLMPPVGTLVVGKRKRATRVDTDALREDLDNELGSLSNSEADDDPNDVDAEAADDRLRVLNRISRGKIDPATLREQVLTKDKPASSSKQPMRRLKRTKHDYTLPRYRDLLASVPELLVPIRLDLEVDGMKLKDSFVWNVKERLVTFKKFAEFLCEDLDIPYSLYGAGIEESMKTQVADFMATMGGEVPFDEDTRIVINLDILFNQYHLVDRFEWDLSSPLTPEAFALQLAQDLGLGSEFPPLVAHAIHEQIARVKSVVVAVGNSAHNPNALVDDVEEANLILGMLRESTRAIEVGLRSGREAEVEEWGPIVEEMTREGVDKYVAEKEKERIRKQRSNRVSGANRRKSGFFIDVNAGYMNAGSLEDGEETWASPEERAAWKCSHCLCPGKHTSLPRSGPNGSKSLCNSCGLFHKSKDELPKHRKDLYYNFQRM